MTPSPSKVETPARDPLTVISDLDAEVLTTLNRLLAQLSTSAAPLTPSSLEAVLNHTDQRMLVAHRDGQIVGIPTLVVVRLVTGLRGHAEDMMVDQEVRGVGMGAALVAAAQEATASAGVRRLIS